MGLINLESIDDFISANRANYQRYREGMRGLSHLSVIEPKAADKRERRNNDDSLSAKS